MPNFLDQVLEETIETVEDDGPYLVRHITRKIAQFGYNPKYSEHAKCTCGHSYYRHFDSYEDMDPVGCKYCQCLFFKQQD